MAWKGHGKTFTFIVYGLYAIPPANEENVAYVDDEDTLIECDMGESLSGWTNCKFKVLKSDGTEAVWDAIPNGTKLEYSNVAGDFNKEGEYKATPYGEAP